MAITILRQPESHDSLGRLSAVNVQLTVGTTADTWCPGLRSIMQVIADPGATNLTSALPDSSSPPNVVFTTTGVVTALNVTVLGYK